MSSSDEDVQPGSAADQQPQEEPQQSPEERARPRKRRSSQLTAAKVDKANEEASKRGLVYLSRIPPFMKPSKLRHLLAQHGEVLRIYLAAEDAAVRSKRKKAGGNSGKRFSEGWVEFADKKVAKRVALTLNSQQIGGPRRSAFYYDLWNIKYLPKFKWDHLTEEIAYQKAVKEQRLALELSASKRERDFYMTQVDQAKAIAAMSEKRQRKAAQLGADGGDAAEDDVDADGGAAPGKKKKKAKFKAAPLPTARMVRRFVQRDVRMPGPGPDVSSHTLAAVFGTGLSTDEA